MRFEDAIAFDCTRCVKSLWIRSFANGAWARVLVIQVSSLLLVLAF